MSNLCKCDPSLFVNIMRSLKEKKTWTSDANDTSDADDDARSGFLSVGT